MANAIPPAKLSLILIRSSLIRRFTIISFGCFLPWIVASDRSSVDASDYFVIQVLDAASGRGVPLVELRTVNDVSYWTDSAGYAAINEPSLVGKSVFFHVASHGYEYPADGFGYRGVKLTVAPKEQATIKLPRKNLAERVYRVTGEGLYRDSILLGKPTPIAQPLLNAGVFGSDSVLTAVFRNKLYWFWGDTNLPNYPLGNFHTPGATSELPSHGGLSPNVGVELNYFTDANGYAKPACKMPGDGPTWIQGLTVLGGDDPATQSMFAGYAKIKPPLDAYEHGIAQWDDDAKEFVHRVTFPKSQQTYPMGHPVLSADNGVEYVYYCHPLPLVRVRATKDAMLDPTQYETYSYIQDGSDEQNIKLERDLDGKLVWKWRRKSILPTRELEEQLVRRKLLAEDERAFRMQTRYTDRRWTLHTSSIAWNEYRNCWIMIGLEAGGESSYLGEVYYSEADSLQGPWSPAIKIVTHDQYTFYNPRLHEMLSEDGGRVLYFEGTYTRTFSASANATPRYDYNQIMYRLELDDARVLTP